MAKVKISEFNSNPALNTDIDGINIAENCPPSGINDAIRELMSQLKDWQSGTSNDPYVVGSSGSLTLNQGTANTVPYLNGSKVVTSGTALSFDGTNLGLGVTPSAWGSGYRALDIGATAAITASSNTFDSWGNAYYNGTSTLYKSTQFATLYRQEVSTGKHIWFNAPSGTAGNAITFTQAMTLDASGNLGVGTTSPSSKLEVAQNSNTQAQVYLHNDDTTTGNYGTQAYFRLAVGGTPVGGLKTTNNPLSGLATKALYLTTEGNYPIAFGLNNGATPSMLLDTSGNLLVGATSAGTAGAFICPATYSYTTGSGANVFVDSSGRIMRSTSSLKYKTDVTDAVHGLADVLKLRSVTYKTKGESDGDAIFGGLIAEEVHAAGLTEFLQYADNGTPDAISYGSMVSLAFKAIQEQQAIIETLTQRIATLEAK